jgi:hypothetical protein
MYQRQFQLWLERAPTNADALVMLVVALLVVAAMLRGR